MILLFRSGTIREKIGLILRATRTHAQNLAKYATIYKATMLALKHTGHNRGKEGNWDTFFAGLLGGYVVFGRRSKNGHVSSVSKQIVIFSMFVLSFQVSSTLSPQRYTNARPRTVFARVCLSLAQLAVLPSAGIIRNTELANRISNDAWPVFAALSWGSVMWLFRWYPETVQSGLRSSMDYIYVQSDHWDSLRNFIVHSK
jgi:peroxisomal membrane protein 4